MFLNILNMSQSCRGNSTCVVFVKSRSCFFTRYWIKL